MPDGPPSAGRVAQRLRADVEKARAEQAVREGRRVRFELDRRPKGAGASRYTEMRCLREALESQGAGRLVDGEWLVKTCREAGALPRFQEMPTDAFWETDSQEDWEAPVVAVSYCWASAEHPDPAGDELKATLGPVLERFIEQHGQAAVFLDWCSLPQHPRSDEEVSRFEQALEEVELWYAHSATVVWMLTEVPSGGLAYKDRGWPSFERAVSSIFMEPAKLLDLGALRDEDLDGLDYEDIVQRCQTPRVPPTDPDEFERCLEEKRFTCEADRSIVVRRYTRTFTDIVVSLDALDCGRCGWDTEAAEQLSRVLPLCTRLERLRLRDNSISDISALSDWLEANVGLQSLNLGRNQIDDVTPLGPAIAVNPTLEYLCLWDNCIADVSPLGSALEENGALTELHLDKNQIVDVSPLGAALMKNKTLLTLNLRLNRIADTSSLGKCLAVNTTLQRLTLDDNEIRDVAEIGAALPANTALRTLELRGNHLFDVSSLGAALSKNVGLQELDVSENPMSKGSLELPAQWSSAGKARGGLYGCEGLEEVALPCLADADVRECSYVDMAGCDNDWTLSGTTLSWRCDDETAPAFETLRFFSRGPDGINYLATEEWYSPLPRSGLGLVLSQLRSMATAAGIEHNILDRMAATAPEDEDSADDASATE